MGDYAQLSRWIRMTAFVLLVGAVQLGLSAQNGVSAQDFCHSDVNSSGCQTNPPSWFWDDEAVCADGEYGDPIGDCDDYSTTSEGCSGNQLRYAAHCQCECDPLEGEG